MAPHVGFFLRDRGASQKERLKDVEGWLYSSEKVNYTFKFIKGYICLVDQLFEIKKINNAIYLPSFIRLSIVSLVFVLALCFLYMNYIMEKSLSGEGVLATIILGLFFNIVLNYISWIPAASAPPPLLQPNKREMFIQLKKHLTNFTSYIK